MAWQNAGVVGDSWGTPSSTAASLACSEAALRIVGKIKAADVCGIELK